MASQFNNEYDDEEYDQENPDEEYDYENGEYEEEEYAEDNLLQKSSGSLNASKNSKISASQQGPSLITPSLVQRKNHPFFDKLFERVEGLLCILVSNAEGSLLNTSVGKSYQQIPEFTSAFAAAFHLASEQANKLPQMGQVDYFLSFYKDFIVVQWSTKTSSTSALTKENSASNLLEEEMLYVTMIGNKTLSVQLLLNFKTIIREFIKKAF